MKMKVKLSNIGESTKKKYIYKNRILTAWQDDAIRLGENMGQRIIY